MDGRLLLRLERCVGCQSLFLICRSCYHGHTYCSDDCRNPARASQLREIRAAHQASPGGRKDHRDRNRELRKRDRELRKRAASITSVMDQGSEILALSSSVCLPQGPSSLMSRPVGWRPASTVASLRAVRVSKSITEPGTGL